MQIFTFIILFIGIIAAIGLSVFLIFNSLGFFTGAPYAATPPKIIDQLFSLVTVSAKDLVYDLGSGDGRVLVAAARKGAHAEGWEINIPLYYYSLRKIRKYRLSHLIHIHLGNFWKTNLSKSTIIFAFLLPDYMVRLEKKLNREVSPGTKVVTYLAKLPTRRPVQTTQDGLAVYQF